MDADCTRDRPGCRLPARVAQTKHEIQSLLAEANSHPRHRFGQNFMIDQNLVRLVAEAGQLSRDDLVIEVGPGTGTLTQELLARAGEVVAVEIDRDLAALLRRKFGDPPATPFREGEPPGEPGPGSGGASPSLSDHASRFSLIEGDALEGKHLLNPQLTNAIRRSLVFDPEAQTRRAVSRP